MKFLVTGGAGFIGSNIVEELLKHNYSVRVLDNFSNGKRENHYEVIQLLETTVPKARIDKKTYDNLKSLIDHKNLISYTGDVYQKKDLEKIRKAFKRFRESADSVLL